MLLLGSLLFLSTLCSQCGPSVDPATTQAIIRVESRGNPFAIGDGTTRKSYFPDSKADAVRLASYLLSQGHNIDMGLMQINRRHLGSKITSLEAMFDPCENIKAGTKILLEFYRKYDDQLNKNEVLFKALSAYNTGSAWKGPAYINRILNAADAPYRVTVINSPKELKARRIEKEAAKHSPDTETAEGSPLFFAGESRIWKE